jgi:hypothetical protein
MVPAAVMYAANAAGFLVCMKTEPGPGACCISNRRVEWKESLPTSEFADQAFRRGHAGDETAGCHTLKFVITVPGYKMTIVDDVFLAGLNLILFVS